MKSLLLGVTIVGAAGVLLGCPVYSDAGGYRICNSYGCFDCPDPFLSNACIQLSCGPGMYCGGACSAAAPCPGGSVCGQDGACHQGDCSSLGCPAGYVCELANGTAQCSLASAAAPDGGADASPAEGGRASDATTDAVAESATEAGSDAPAGD